MSVLLQPVKTPVMEFGPCLRQILAEKRISASELARMMAYKSRNSIFRILDGEGGHSARQAFYERLIGEDPLKLCSAEKEKLAQALEISRVGMKTFFSNRAMLELISSEQGDDAERIEILSEQGDESDEVLRVLAGSREIHLTVLGCSSRAVFTALKNLMAGLKHTAKIGITHFIYTGADEVIRNISAIQPLMYSEIYQAYGIEAGAYSPERESMYRSNVVFAHICAGDGTKYSRVFIMTDRNCFFAFPRMKKDERNMLQMILGDDVKKMQLIKRDYCVQNADYPAYTKACLALEQNRAIYTIKLDVPISYISADILLDCLRDELAAGKIAETEELAETAEQLAVIHRMRWENFFGKHKATHTIFSRKAMEEFAQTGKQTDHFFALRPYKPEERVQILTHIRRQAAENPYFDVYFFKEDYAPPKMEIGLYEGMGTLLNKPFTHYDLQGDHAETLITQKEFCERYKEYFMEDLLVRHVIGKEETLTVLDELIQMAKSSR